MLIMMMMATTMNGEIGVVEMIKNDRDLGWMAHASVSHDDLLFFFSSEGSLK